MTFWYYIQFIYLTTSEKHFTSKEELRYFEDMTNLRRYVTARFEQYELDLKNMIVGSFEKIEKSEDVLKDNFDVLFPLFNINNQVESMNLSSEFFFEKYSKSLEETLELIQHIFNWLFNDFEKSFNFMKRSIFDFMLNNEIQKNGVHEEFEKIKHDNNLLHSKLNAFEDEIFSTELNINTLQMNNQNHNHKPYPDFLEEQFNHINTCFNKTDLCNIRPYIYEGFKYLTSTNTRVVKFKDTVDYYERLFISFFRDLDIDYLHLANYIYKLQKIFDVAFVNDSFLVENLTDKEIENLSNIFQPIFSKIQMTFLEFFNNYFTLQNKIAEDFFRIFIRYKKSLVELKIENNEETNIILKKCSDYFIINILKYNFKLNYILSKPINTVIHQWQNPVINDYSKNEKVMNLYNDNFDVYNALLLEKFPVYFFDLFINHDFDSYYNDFTRLAITNHENKSYPEIEVFLSINNRQIDIEQIKNTIIQVENLFTNGEIKKKCLYVFLKCIDTYEKLLTSRLDILTKRLYPYKSIFTLDLEEKIKNYALAENNYAILMKEIIETRIKIKESLHQNDVTKGIDYLNEIKQHQNNDLTKDGNQNENNDLTKNKKQHQDNDLTKNGNQNENNDLTKDTKQHKNNDLTEDKKQHESKSVGTVSNNNIFIVFTMIIFIIAAVVMIFMVFKIK